MIKRALETLEQTETERQKNESRGRIGVKRYSMPEIHTYKAT